MAGKMRAGAKRQTRLAPGNGCVRVLHVSYVALRMGPPLPGGHTGIVVCLPDLVAAPYSSPVSAFEMRQSLRAARRPSAEKYVSTVTKSPLRSSLYVCVCVCAPAHACVSSNVGMQVCTCLFCSRQAGTACSLHTSLHYLRIISPGMQAGK